MTMEDYEVDCLRKERNDEERDDLMEELAKLRPYLIEAADEDTAYDEDLWHQSQHSCRYGGMGPRRGPLFGHCGAVAWYVRLLYGGEVLRGEVLDTRIPTGAMGWGSFDLERGLGRGLAWYLNFDEVRRHSHTHYWNRLGIYSDIDVDLTSDQFKGDGINPLECAPNLKVSQTIDAPGVVVRGPEVKPPGKTVNPRFKKFGERVSQAKYGFSLAQLIQNIDHYTERTTTEIQGGELR